MQTIRKFKFEGNVCLRYLPLERRHKPLVDWKAIDGRRSLFDSQPIFIFWSVTMDSAVEAHMIIGTSIYISGYAQCIHADTL